MGLNYKCLGKYEETADRIEGNIIVGVGAACVIVVGLLCLGIVKIAKAVSEENKPHAPNDGL